MALEIMWIVIFLEVIDGHLISDYQNTMVYKEKTSCKKNQFYNLVEEISVSSVITCGVECSKHTQCRRFMFDKNTKLCSLFESGESCFTDGNIGDMMCFKQKSTCDNNGTCIRCPIGYYGNTCQYIIQDCSHGYQLKVAPEKELLSYIQPKPGGEILLTKCYFEHGGLTFVQFRDVHCNEVYFNRTWDEYSKGFGQFHSEYWLGLQHIYDILHNYPRFKLNVFVRNDGVHQGYYDYFQMSNSSEDYRFTVGGFKDNPSTSLGDSLTNGSYSLEGRPFSTYDRDYSNNNCPDRFKGGWWYLDSPDCSRGNVNGQRSANFEATTHWTETRGNESNFDVVFLAVMRV